MAKGGITWKTRDEEGRSREVNAERVGSRWVIAKRDGRYDAWETDPSPTLDDWLVLLDGVRRRRGRHLMDADDEKTAIAGLRAAYPDAEIPKRR